MKSIVAQILRDRDPGPPPIIVCGVDVLSRKAGRTRRRFVQAESRLALKQVCQVKPG